LMERIAFGHVKVEYFKCPADTPEPIH